MSEDEKSMLEGDLQDRVISKYHSDLDITHTQIVKLPGFTTQSGYELKEIEVSYQTLGKLTPNKDNVILVCHALSGDAHLAGINPKTGRPGWWDFHVGPGKSIDTNKYYVKCSNCPGCSGLQDCSIEPRYWKAPYAPNFTITIRDMVKTQTLLLKHLA
jgi:homoserine O-acetyltransferase